MKKFAMLGVLAMLALGACDEDDDLTAPPTTARVRFVNAAPGAGAVSAFHGNVAIATGVAVGAANTCGNTMRLAAGPRTITLRAGTTPASAQVARVSHVFEADKDYTVVLYGPSTARTAVVLEDAAPGTVAAANNAVRFINATTTAGDVFVTAAGATPSGTPIALTPGAATNPLYREFPVTSTSARLFNTGTTEGTARGSHTLTNLPARIATVVFMDPATTGGATGFQFTPCP
jgi:hypothetical protein